MGHNRTEVLAGSLLCIVFAVMVYGWLVVPILESALRAAK